MKKAILIHYKSIFSIEEQSIISDYLDTKDGEEDNTLKSYIKVNLSKLIHFVNENTDKYEKTVDMREAIAFIKEALENFSEKYTFLNLK